MSGIVLLQNKQQLQRHFFLVKCIAANRAAGGQVVTALLDDDARPQHAGGVVGIKVVGQHDALFQFGDTRLVAGFGGALALQGVDQGGFTHIGHAANQHPHWLDHAAAQWGQQAARGDEALGGCCFAGIQGDSAGVGQGVVMCQPKGSAQGVGNILLIQDFEGGRAADQFGQHGVGAGAGHACVQQFDHHVGLFEALGDGFFGQVHVTGEPLDGHVFTF